ILPLALAVEKFPLASYGWVDWAGIIYLSVMGTAVAYFLFIYGISHVEASAGSMVFFLKPFLAALLAWWVLDELLSIREVVAGAVILTGMLIALAPARRKQTG
ncbi:MAG: DMT family transporter, partial [Kiritimatiellaceae bacterium]|nr:DMT family transporter [Kiritimatiellaceae bacterium]